MAKVKTLADLRRMKSELQSKIQLRENAENPESVVQVRVGMATSGIASGAKEVYSYFNEEMAKRNLNGITVQVGDMGYCYAEPTVEVLIPGKEPIVFGYVDVEKADQIIEKYIKNGELLDGIIPPNYQNINE
ncbi:MAG: (2Fe-2S) ferredoxin domain-containing protein [Bacteroidales bacterium]|nr:(2Fe-2S) ferredoxin domain-containing protein [Bacteroidales bacterium]